MLEQIDIVLCIVDIILSILDIIIIIYVFDRIPQKEKPKFDKFGFYKNRNRKRIWKLK